MFILTYRIPNAKFNGFKRYSPHNLNIPAMYKDYNFNIYDAIEYWINNIATHDVNYVISDTSYPEAADKNIIDVEDSIYFQDKNDEIQFKLTFF